MTYQRLGLGALILSALGVTNDDPQQNERLSALETGLTDMTSRFEQLRQEVAAGGNLDAEQQASLDAMAEDLNGIASALNRAAPVVQPAPEADTSVLEPTPEEQPAEPAGDEVETDTGGQDNGQEEDAGGGI